MSLTAQMPNSLVNLQNATKKKYNCKHNLIFNFK